MPVRKKSPYSRQRARSRALSTRVCCRAAVEAKSRDLGAIPGARAPLHLADEIKSHAEQAKAEKAQSAAAATAGGGVREGEGGGAGGGSGGGGEAAPSAAPADAPQ